MRSALLAVLLAACTPLPPVVEPTPAPAAEDCGAAHSRALQLHCDDADHPLWVESCERHEDEGGALAWNAGCMSRAASCEAQELCRSGQ